MNAPPCLRCCVMMKCAQTGAILELMTEHRGYQLWSADVFKCDGCGAVTAIFGQSPITRNNQGDYAEMVRAYRPVPFWSTFRERDRYRSAPEVMG
jgi:hypothetical protein